jgi:hypothetical protein
MDAAIRFSNPSHIERGARPAQETAPDPAGFCEAAGDISSECLYIWETKEGNLRLRPKTKSALLSLRGVGVREAKRSLTEGQGEAE